MRTFMELLLVGLKMALIGSLSMAVALAIGYILYLLWRDS